MQIQYKLLAVIVVSSSMALIGGPSHSHSQFIQKRTTCPSRSTSAGGGYCRADDGYHFVPKLSTCPFGSSSAGGGYCRADNDYQYVRKLTTCPYGTTSTGGGYCRF